MSKAKLKYLIGALLILGATWYVLYYTKTPEYSLNQVGKAILQSDKATFEKYVELDSLTHNIFSRYDSYKKLPDSMKEIQRLSARKHVTEAIRRSSIERADNRDRTSVTYMVHYIISHDSYKGIFDIETTGHDVAVATLNFNFADFSNMTFTMDVVMRKIDGYWQIVNVPNYDEFTESLQNFVMK